MICSRVEVQEQEWFICMEVHEKGEVDELISPPGARSDMFVDDRKELHRAWKETVGTGNYV